MRKGTDNGRKKHHHQVLLKLTKFKTNFGTINPISTKSPRTRHKVNQVDTAAMVFEPPSQSIYSHSRNQHLGTELGLTSGEDNNQQQHLANSLWVPSDSPDIVRLHPKHCKSPPRRR